MAQDWFQSTQDHKGDVQAMMAHSNKDVVSLNTMARTFKKTSGEIGSEDFIFTIERNAGEELGEKKTEFVERSFSTGDQIIFTKNDTGLGVSNGSLGRITEINDRKITVLVKSGDTEKEVSFSPNLYKNFDNGWAVTLHKNQGVTVDRSFVLGSYEQYKNLSYVGMTRHSIEAKLYTSTFDFWKQEKVYDRLGRTQDKLSSLDYLDKNQVTTLIKAEDHTLGETLKKVGQNIEAIGYMGHKKWESICEKFQGYTPRKPLIQVPSNLLGNLKSEADRADEMFAKKKESAEKNTDGALKDKSSRTTENPSQAPEKPKFNPFKVDRLSGNPFDVGGMGK